MPLKLITSGGGSVILDANTTGSTYTINVPAEGGSMLTTGSLNGVNASAASVGTLPHLRLPSGAILQRTANSFVTQFTTQTTTFTNIITVSITPKSATSRIWLVASVHVGKRSSGELQFAHRFLRNGTTGVTQHLSSNNGSNIYDQFRCTGTADAAYHNHHILYAYDEPATTSSVTYNFQVAAPDAGYQAIYYNFNNARTMFIAEELAQ